MSHSPLHTGLLTAWTLCRSYAGSHSYCEFMRSAVLKYPEDTAHSVPFQTLATKIFLSPLP